MSVIMFDKVSKKYNKNDFAIKNINFVIEQGEFVFITGRSGSGKSTLLKLITKELEPSSGTIIVKNINTGKIKKREIPMYRRTLGIVSQEANLLDDRNVYENIAFAMFVIEQPQELIDKSVPAALRVVGMAKKALCFPNELSGGERFRIALARAIVNNPSVIIADEPTANLDNDIAWDIMCLLNDMSYRGATVIVATHAKELVNIMGKRVLTLNHGHLAGDVKKGRYGSVV